MNRNATHAAYAIVTFGRINASGETRKRSFYRSLDSAIRDAKGLRGPSSIRVVGCTSVAEAKGADISDGLPVVWRR